MSTCLPFCADPPFYDDLVAALGIFSLDFLEIMPLGACSRSPASRHSRTYCHNLTGISRSSFPSCLPSAECSIPLNHDWYLLIRTLLPLLLGLLAFLARWRLRASAARKRKTAQGSTKTSTTSQGDSARADKLLKGAVADDAVADTLSTCVFVLFYLLYPSTSANIFATFQCETLDDPMKSSFLRKDFAVDVRRAAAANAARPNR